MQPYFLMVVKAELKTIPGLRANVASISFPLWSRASTAHLSSILSLAFPTFTCVFIIPTPRQEHGRSTVIILGVLLANSAAGYPLPTGNCSSKAQGGQVPGAWGGQRKNHKQEAENWDKLGSAPILTHLTAHTSL